MLRSGGVARPLATPCRQAGPGRRAIESPIPPTAASPPTTHGSEGRIYLVRAPIMPMLAVQDGKPVIFQPFKMRGAALSGLQGRTLGTRKRFRAGEGFRLTFFREDPEPNDAVEESADNGSHRLVLWTPPHNDPEHRQEVVVDPMLSKVLREHQRVGVQFLFDCMMGLREYEGFGCILADDMGLGKTLQAVAIIWTLLTQGGPGGKAACRKAVIVCPASLVKNWACEFDKWLHGRCKYVAVAVSGAAAVRGTLMTFKASYEHKVLIASYETFRGYADEVRGCGISLVVCDEAHKLKNDEAAITQCISGLEAKCRMLISGTPIQNNLGEFFTLVNVANPGVFGDMASFKRNFATPILRGREPSATGDERQKGQEMLEYISTITGQFILRRTNRLNARFLPPKQVLNVFVQPTDFQRRLYRSFLRSSIAQKVLSEDNVKMNRTVLGTIKKLQSLVNHPFLIRSATERLDVCFDDDESRALFESIDKRERNMRSNARPVHEELSGKMFLLHGILVSIKESGSGDRIVIISNWTQTLDLIEKMCINNKWPLHRLDGTMAIARRMKLVQDFNRPDNQNAFAFLLSSKAGGCGLNLIGASRLVMYDPDWNPANDRQAMARIWRDGQKKNCFIYRFFTTGTIDEKVYQRQICKDGLSTMMVTETGDEDATEMKESLSADLVKDLFSFDEDTLCSTHEMIGCKRCRRRHHVAQSDEVLEDDLNTWSHHHGVEGVDDDILAKAAKRIRPGEKNTTDYVSFCMGCHIEYTPEQIAKIEEEENKLQKKREEAVNDRLSDAALTNVSKTAAKSVAKPSGPGAEVKTVPGNAAEETNGTADSNKTTKTRGAVALEKIEAAIKKARTSKDTPPKADSAQKTRWKKVDHGDFPDVLRRQRQQAPVSEGNPAARTTAVPTPSVRSRLASKGVVINVDP